MAMREQYLAIAHDNTTPHSNREVLKLAKNQKLAKQSYVNLDQFFTIEACHLQRWRQGQHQLDSASISSLEKALLDFISGTTRRRHDVRNCVISPLDYHPPQCLTALWLGVRDVRFAPPSKKRAAIAICAPSGPPPSPPPSKRRCYATVAASAVHASTTSTNWRVRN